MKTCIHVGSESIDNHSHTQAQTDAVIAAIVAAIPSADYIAIGTYLDYASEVQKWATSIHNAGKKMWLRSLGFNDWRGTNSVAQYTGSDFYDHSRLAYGDFVGINRTFFASGDIFEPVPDEPENNSRWNAQYGNITSGAGQTAFNSFLTSNFIRLTLDIVGLTGVTCNHVFTSPATSKNSITYATAESLNVCCTDHYPEGSLTDHAALLLNLVDNFRTYTMYDKIMLPKHIHIGPNTNAQLPEAEQKEAYRKYLYLIQKSYASLDGITVYEFGSTDNSRKARLFDFTNNTWVPRSSCALIERFFSVLKTAPATRYPTSAHNMRFVYVYASDQSLDQNKLKKFRECAYRIQCWYPWGTNGHKTFTMKNPYSPVETVQLSHAASYYLDKNGFDVMGYEATQIIGEGNIRDIKDHWVFCLDFPFNNGGANYNSFVVFALFSELTNTDANPLNDEYHGAGAYAHEIGHTFGLDHPEPPPTSGYGGEWSTLMGIGYGAFPNVDMVHRHRKEVGIENHYPWGSDASPPWFGAGGPSTGRALAFLQNTWGINSFHRQPRI